MSLGNVAGGALLQRLHRDLATPVGSHQDHGQRGISLADRLDQLEPVDLRHHQIRDDDVRLSLLDGAQRLGAVDPGAGLEARGLQDALDHQGLIGAVVDDQYVLHHELL